MRKLLIFAIFLFSSSAFAVDYWACASADAGAANEWDTVSAACTGTKLTWASRASGAVLHANNFTVVLSQATSGDPGANGAVTLSNDNSAGSTAGGGFTCATATGSTTITLAGMTGGSVGTPVLTIIGSSGSGCNLAGAGTGTGGSAASAAAVSDTHTIVALTHAFSFTGGSNSTAYGYTWTGNSGTVTINGTCTATVGQGCNAQGSGASLVVTNCVGSDSTVNIVGCSTSSSSTVKVTGNMIYGKKAAPTNGTVLYTPGATNCIMVQGAAAWATTPATCAATDGTHQQMPSDINLSSQTKVLTGTQYGSYTGTAASGAQNSGSVQ